MRKRLFLLLASVCLLALIAMLFLASWILGRPERLLQEARTAAKARDWEASAKAWHEYNGDNHANAGTFLEEARAWLAMGCAAKAETALNRAISRDSVPSEPWLLLLEMRRVEGRAFEAQEIGWRGYEAVSEPGRRAVLKGITLALLAEAPENIARGTLSRWSEADPEDVEARVALLRRMAVSPRSEDPDLSTRIAELTDLCKRYPKSISTREALILAMAEAGDPKPVEALLEAWPEADRDARYHRLKGRWELETARKPDRAIASFQKTLSVLPHDWKTRNWLSRAYNAAGRAEEAKQEAKAVERLRELLDPLSFSKRIDADLTKLEDPKSRTDLADLCEAAGLHRLAEAWRRDARMVVEEKGVGPIFGREK